LLPQRQFIEIDQDKEIGKVDVVHAYEDAVEMGTADAVGEMGIVQADEGMGIARGGWGIVQAHVEMDKALVDGHDEALLLLKRHGIGEYGHQRCHVDWPAPQEGHLQGRLSKCLAHHHLECTPLLCRSRSVLQIHMARSLQSLPRRGRLEDQPPW